ncbi:MAG: DUF998 domain-containing protein [Stackebrandtia sp.]
MTDDVIKTRFAGVAAVAGAVVGMASFGLMHVLMAEEVNPVRQPVSAYALASPGDALFVAGASGLAVACAALAVGGRGPARQASVRLLLAVTSAMLVLAAAFPTDSGVNVSTVGGQIHRYSAGAAFVLITLAGFAACVRGRREDVSAAARRATMLLTVVCAATFLVTTVNTFLPELADGGQWRGLPQRVLLAAQSLLIVTLAWAPRERRAVLAVPPRGDVSAPANLAAAS